SNPSDLPQAIVDVRGLESLRRAMAAAVRSFKLASEIVSGARLRGPEPGSPAGVGQLGRATKPLLTRGLLTPVTLSAFVAEVERSLNSQSLLISNANRDGLRVLEA